MPTDSATLVVQCQLALGLTQKELGALLGKDRRTIQRWQDRGCKLLPADAQTLADALRPVRPDLADEVLAHGRAMAAALGVCTPPVLDAILEAAAAAAGTSVDAVRPAVAAAFERAAEAGVNVNAVVAALGED